VTSDLEEAATQYYQARANVVGLRMDVIEDYRTQSVNGGGREEGGRSAPEIPTRSPSRLFARNRETGIEYVNRLSSEPPTVVESTPPDSDYDSDHTLERNRPGSEARRSPDRKQSSASSKATAKSARESIILSDPSTPPQTPPGLSQYLLSDLKIPREILRGHQIRQ